MNDKLGTAKRNVDKYIKVADCGIFRTRNLVGDPMITVYEDEGLQIDLCFTYSYLEVFGLTESEFRELEKYYKDAQQNRQKEE